ncbi:MAG: hypothetical protein HUU25_08885 [Candidatus Sumerlaeia bacterium]|nr:hypothetical protein [Candidatus Sumerlaeia bacterium]
MTICGLGLLVGRGEAQDPRFAALPHQDLLAQGRVADYLGQVAELERREPGNANLPALYLSMAEQRYDAEHTATPPSGSENVQRWTVIARELSGELGPTLNHIIARWPRTPEAFRAERLLDQIARRTVVDWPLDGTPHGNRGAFLEWLRQHSPGLPSPVISGAATQGDVFRVQIAAASSEVSAEQMAAAFGEAHPEIQPVLVLYRPETSQEFPYKVAVGEYPSPNMARSVARSLHGGAFLLTDEAPERQASPLAAAGIEVADGDFERGLRAFEADAPRTGITVANAAERAEAVKVDGGWLAAARVFAAARASERDSHSPEVALSLLSSLYNSSQSSQSSRQGRFVLLNLARAAAAQATEESRDTAATLEADLVTSFVDYRLASWSEDHTVALWRAQARLESIAERADSGPRMQYFGQLSPDVPLDQLARMWSINLLLELAYNGETSYQSVLDACEVFAERHPHPNHDMDARVAIMRLEALIFQRQGGDAAPELCRAVRETFADVPGVAVAATLWEVQQLVYARRSEEAIAVCDWAAATFTEDDQFTISGVPGARWDALSRMQIHKGLALVALGRFEEAHAVFTNLVEEHPDCSRLSDVFAFYGQPLTYAQAE